MTNKPQASIIIPVFNEAEAIESTISQLLAAPESRNWEIIAVNDSSTDKTREILGKFNQIRVIDHAFNKGYGAARERSSREAARLLALLPSGVVPAGRGHADVISSTSCCR